MKDKTEKRAAIYERAANALRDLYHNATITFPRDDYGRTEEYFQGWLNDAAQFEIEYISDGGAYGKDYRRTLEAPCNAGRYKSPAAREYYVRRGMQKMREERADCGVLTGWRVLELAAGNQKTASLLERYPGAKRGDSQWERITEFGKLYQWGRGGRTLAPDDLIRQGGGGSFSIREDYFAERPLAEVIDGIRILESFNRYVGAWCAGVPEMWREHCETEDAEARAEKQRASARKAKETRERRYWEARDVVTVQA